ncbi:MAG: glycosyltransferase [Deltaproteobacteria bacterium]|nr:glycosyltransferase [Deltaproteobacteria bacterium]
MNILMMTNTFPPYVGGVARSVEAFTVEYRKRGHRVLVVAPEYENMPENEIDVIRIPAIQRFNGSDFSVILSTPGYLTEAIEEFKPDIVHSHHPFLIGVTAFRMARKYELPLVFTHHTMYEQYTHYVPGDSETLKRFVIKLSTSYSNLCDQVFAPSESVASVLGDRGVFAPIDVVPTGVNLEQFACGNGPGFRAAMDIPQDAIVVGHVGRLAPEKNLEFLAKALVAFFKNESRAHFLVVGGGPSSKTIQQIFFREKMAGRLHIAGVLDHPLLTSAYRAMDVFAFASKSETQGMVLTEAMAAGVPVVALDAPGVREVVVDHRNGRLLYSETVEEFSSALQRVVSLPSQQMQQLKQAAENTAEKFSIGHSADKALTLYKDLLDKEFFDRHKEYSAWTTILHKIKTEWDVIKGLAGAAGAALNIDVLEGKRKP